MITGLHWTTNRKASCNKPLVQKDFKQRFFTQQIAKSGLDDEEIVLMDDRGCPADPVFPGLTKENGTGALIGRFEAFKFSDSKMIRWTLALFWLFIPFLTTLYKLCQ